MIMDDEVGEPWRKKGFVRRRMKQQGIMNFEVETANAEKVINILKLVKNFFTKNENKISNCCYNSNRDMTNHIFRHPYVSNSNNLPSR